MRNQPAPVWDNAQDHAGCPFLESVVRQALPAHGPYPFAPMHKGSREPSARTMAANYRVTHQPGNGQHFTRVATNGQVIATSQHYETHRSRLEGIESVRKNATTAEVEDGSAQ